MQYNTCTNLLIYLHYQSKNCTYYTHLLVQLYLTTCVLHNTEPITETLPTLYYNTYTLLALPLAPHGPRSCSLLYLALLHLALDRRRLREPRPVGG